MIRKLGQIILRGPSTRPVRISSVATRKPGGASTWANSSMVGCGGERPGNMSVALSCFDTGQTMDHHLKLSSNKGLPAILNT